MKSLTPQEFARADRLRELGVVFDDQEFKRMRRQSRGLTIWQNCDLPSAAFDLPRGAGYAFNLVIANESSTDMLSPYSIRVDPPEWESQIRLLPDPRRNPPCKYPGSYFLDTQQAGYERETVLNHVVGGTRRLVPGEHAEGYLLALGEYRIPLKYQRHDRFKVRLTLFDQRGRSSTSVFQMTVERNREHARMIEAIANSKRRRKLIPTVESSESYVGEFSK